MHSRNNIPLVAIVGRPNAGKSSLFNRLVRSRTAIVHKEPGVTRDRLIRPAVWKEKTFDLADTGGLDFSRETAPTPEMERIRNAVHLQAQYAIRDADILIFMADVEAGLTPLDEELAHRLRRHGKTVFLAANKTDNQERERMCADFHRLGFPVFPISATHFTGVPALMDAVASALPHHEDNARTDSDKPLRVAVVGRPNVGKSSFLNALLGDDRLIVSDVPGVTRDSVDIPFAAGDGDGARNYVLIDTSGIRRIRGPRDAVEYFSVTRAENSLATADIAVIMLDAAAGPTAQDKKIASMVVDHVKGCVLAVNKWDLARGVKRGDYENALRNAMPFMDFAPVIFMSSKTGFNVGRALETIGRVAEHMNTRLPTGPLNRAIACACGRTNPPSVKGGKLKIYYAVQTGSAPPAITLFVNDTKRMARSFEQFIARTIRENFALEGAPLVIRLRSSHAKSSG